MPILDTNLIIGLDRDDPAAIEALRRLESQPLIVPFQVALEYALGTPHPEESLLALAGAYAVDRPEWPVLQTATRMAAEARAAGHRPMGGDVWIAAAAAVRDDFVVTTNKRDFTRLGVAAWHYEKEADPPS